MSEWILYTHPQSRGRIAHWMMEEIGEPYETVWVDFGPPMKAQADRAVNPMGKVPALRHGDAVVTEAAAICAYLAEVFPEQGLLPRPAFEAYAARVEARPAYLRAVQLNEERLKATGG